MPSDRLWPQPPLARSLAVRLDLPYMTAGECDAFASLRESGKLSFYRVQTCRRCGADVPRPKQFCCKEHMMEHAENMDRMEDGVEMMSGDVVSVVKRLVGRRIALETKDGSRRTGELTDVKWSSVQVDGIDVVWPDGLILGGDRTDVIKWEWLAWVRKA